MRITNLVWGGTKTDRFDETVSFCRDVLGMELADTESGFAAFQLPGGDKFEVFGPEDSDHDHLTTGPVIGFGVEDVDSARSELESKGVEFIGPTKTEGRHTWAHFRGPDGNVYEIATG